MNLAGTSTTGGVLSCGPKVRCRGAKTQGFRLGGGSAPGEGTSGVVEPHGGRDYIRSR